jgi:tRNA G18 (ribose-2'-O)-methylase SpoU
MKTVGYTQFVQTYASTPHVTLVIGNESTGIDPRLTKITKIPKENQANIHVPMANQVESLNCTLAFGVLGFEIRKIFKK